VDGPEIVALTVSVPSIEDRFGNVWQYHSRSDYHSKVACWAILFDLMRESSVLRRHVQDDKVIFGLNHEMQDFRTGRKKNLDLVVARHGNGGETTRTFADMAADLAIQLTPTQRAALGTLPTLYVGPVGAVLIALEAKRV
jgi:hypothetical protein